MHLLNGETLARRRDAHELALVRAAGRAAYRHHVPVRDDVLDVKRVSGNAAISQYSMCLAPAIPR